MTKHNHRNRVYESTPNQDSNTLTSIGPETSQNQPKQDEFQPNYYDIQLRAYQIYQQRGGSDLDNWIEAERSLKEENAQGRGKKG